MTRHGVPLQYSVFVVSGSIESMASLVADIAGYVDDEDDVRVWQVPDSPRLSLIGRSCLSDEALLLDGSRGIGMLLGVAGPESSNTRAQAGRAAPG
jgi:hypothetical protein